MNHKILPALKAAFPHTLPILAGFSFLGLAYGILMNASGFSFLYPTLISMLVFGGSIQFVSVSMLTSAFAPLQAFLMAVMLQTRHLFYGIAMLDKFRDTGWKKFFLIFAMCDETFSVNCSVTLPEGIDRGWFFFFVTLLDYSYWVISSLLGGILGSALPFRTDGIDFVMTAMFAVILLEHWLKEKQHLPVILGAASSLLCLFLFGADGFLIPAMLCIVLLLTLFRKPIEQGGIRP